MKYSQEDLKHFYFIKVGQALRELIKQHGLNQREFAKLIGKKESEVSRFLSGKHNFTVETIWFICEKLKIKPKSFFPQKDKHLEYMFKVSKMKFDNYTAISI